MFPKCYFKDYFRNSMRRNFEKRVLKKSLL